MICGSRFPIARKQLEHVLLSRQRCTDDDRVSRLVIAGPVEAKGVIKERKQKVRKVVSTALKDKRPRAIPESRKHRTPYGGRWSSPTLTF